MHRALQSPHNPRMVRTSRLSDQEQVTCNRADDLGPHARELLRTEEGEGSSGIGIVRPVVSVVVQVERRDEVVHVLFLDGISLGVGVGMETREVAEEKFSEGGFVLKLLIVVFAGGEEGAEALGVLLPGVRAEEDGGLVIGVVYVVRRVHAGADAEIRVALAALFDAAAVAEVMNPPGAAKLNANFSGGPVAQRSDSLPGCVAECSDAVGVNPLEGAEGGAVEHCVVSPCFDDCVTSACRPSDINVQVQSAGAILNGRDAGEVFGLVGKSVFHPNRELLGPSEDRVPLDVVVIIVFKVKGLQHCLAVGLIVPIRAASSHMHLSAKIIKIEKEKENENGSQVAAGITNPLKVSKNSTVS